jgi:predicted DNA-binding protein with PD1-like motif
MVYKQFGSTYLVRILQGEEILSGIKEFIQKSAVNFASFQGLGALGKAVIGSYDVKNKHYHSTTLEGDYEIVSLLGSITEKDGEPYIHAHINLSDRSFHCFGGHLNSGVVSGTCEIFIRAIDGRVKRNFNPETGLSILDL